MQSLKATSRPMWRSSHYAQQLSRPVASRRCQQQLGSTACRHVRSSFSSAQFPHHAHRWLRSNSMSQQVQRSGFFGRTSSVDRLRLFPFGRRASRAVHSSKAVRESTKSNVNGSSSSPAPPSPLSNDLLRKIKTLAPGILAAGFVMEAGFQIADVLGTKLLQWQGLQSAAKSPISGVPVAILLGLALNNLVKLPATLAPGLKTCTTTLLRAGIICIGAKLSLFDVLKLGAAGVPVVVASISSGLLFVPWFARRLGLPARLGSLIAVGTSICGVTAITALAPAIRASSQEVAFAVANVVAFGLAGMLAYPYLAHATLPSSEQVGLFLGTAVHDTSQVMGCALTYKELYDDELALKVAAVTKMTRNLFLAAVIPALTWKYAKDTAAAAAAASATGAAALQPKMNLKTMFPLFVLGFLGMAVVRSLGDASLKSREDRRVLGVISEEQWEKLAATIGDKLGGHYLLGMAMASVGLSTNMSVLRGVGAKPFVVGLGGAAVVGATGYSASRALGRFLQFEGSGSSTTARQQ